MDDPDAKHFQQREQRASGTLPSILSPQASSQKGGRPHNPSRGARRNTTGGAKSGDKLARNDGAAVPAAGVTTATTAALLVQAPDSAGDKPAISVKPSTLFSSGVSSAAGQNSVKSPPTTKEAAAPPPPAPSKPASILAGITSKVGMSSGGSAKGAAAPAPAPAPAATAASHVAPQPAPTTVKQPALTPVKAPSGSLPSAPGTQAHALSSSTSSIKAPAATPPSNKAPGGVPPAPAKGSPLPPIPTAGLSAASKEGGLKSPPPSISQPAFVSPLADQQAKLGRRATVDLSMRRAAADKEHKDEELKRDQEQARLVREAVAHQKEKKAADDRRAKEEQKRVKEEHAAEERRVKEEQKRLKDEPKRGHARAGTGESRQAPPPTAYALGPDGTLSNTAPLPRKEPEAHSASDDAQGDWAPSPRGQRGSPRMRVEFDSDNKTPPPGGKGHQRSASDNPDFVKMGHTRSKSSDMTVRTPPAADAPPPHNSDLPSPKKGDKGEKRGKPKKDKDKESGSRSVGRKRSQTLSRMSARLMLAGEDEAVTPPAPYLSPPTAKQSDKPDSPREPHSPKGSERPDLDEHEGLGSSTGRVALKGIWNALGLGHKPRNDTSGGSSSVVLAPGGLSNQGE